MNKMMKKKKLFRIKHKHKLEAHVYSETAFDSNQRIQNDRMTESDEEIH